MKEIEKPEDDLFLGGGYSAPEKKEAVLNTTSGKLEDIKELPILEQIKIAAKKFNITMNDSPKKNCKKCYERGYVGFNSEDKTPIPCNCLFPASQLPKGQVPLNLMPKKVQRKYYREKEKALRKEIKKESTMRELRKIKQDMINKLALSATDKPNESEVIDGTEVSQG